MSDKNILQFQHDWDSIGDISSSYQQWMVQDGKATLGFSEITSKAGNILKSFGATLGSMGVNWIIGEVISFAAKKLYEMTHAEEIAAEKAKEFQENSDDIAANIKSTNETLNAYTKTVEEVGKRYAELA